MDLVSLLQATKQYLNCLHRVTMSYKFDGAIVNIVVYVGKYPEALKAGFLEVPVEDFDVFKSACPFVDFMNEDEL